MALSEVQLASMKLKKSTIKKILKVTCRFIKRVSTNFNIILNSAIVNYFYCDLKLLNIDNTSKCSKGKRKIKIIFLIQECRFEVILY